MFNISGVITEEMRAAKMYVLNEISISLSFDPIKKSDLMVKTLAEYCESHNAKRFQVMFVAV